MPPSRLAFVVLGMHRGGTSAVAGQLQRLGIDFGPRLVPADADNPRGYYEHRDLVNLHDRLLLRLDSAWDDVRLTAATVAAAARTADDDPLARVRADLSRLGEQLRATVRRDFLPSDDEPPAPAVAGRAPWGLKDPRLCRLLPVWESWWERFASRPCFLLVLRHPGAVAASLRVRNGFSAHKSALLWAQHYLEAERLTRGHPRLLFRFEDFLSDWRGTLRPLRDRLAADGFADHLGPDFLALRTPRDEEFLDPTLRHHGATPTAGGGPPPGSHPRPAGLTPALPPWSEEAYHALSDLRAGAETGVDPVESHPAETDPVSETDLPPRPTTDPRRSRLDRLTADWPRWLAEYDQRFPEQVEDLRAELAGLRHRANWYEQEWAKAQARLDRAAEKIASQRLRLQRRSEGSSPG